MNFLISLYLFPFSLSNFNPSVVPQCTLSGSFLLNCFGLCVFTHTQPCDTDTAAAPCQQQQRAECVGHTECSALFAAALFRNGVWMRDCSVWPNLNCDISRWHDVYWKGCSYLASEDVLSLLWKAGDLLKGMMKHCHLKALCCFVLEKIQAAFSFLDYCIAYFL